ncbi:MAG: hypothetical protein H0W34_00950 [Pyrinomonadaceae bacterium]|nr:hypothetical protein [Pyrinomonadaceae bacterium]
MSQRKPVPAAKVCPKCQGRGKRLVKTESGFAIAFCSCKDGKRLERDAGGDGSPTKQANYLKRTYRIGRPVAAA